MMLLLGVPTFGTCQFPCCLEKVCDKYQNVRVYSCQKSRHVSFDLFGLMSELVQWLRGSPFLSNPSWLCGNRGNGHRGCVVIVGMEDDDGRFQSHVEDGTCSTTTPTGSPFASEETNPTTQSTIHRTCPKQP